jgi:aryl-alcohol dehydrogenase-like predicted oxidoreductase
MLPLPPRSLGFGCFSLTGGYGAVDSTAAIAVVHRALDLGVTLFDTADAYAGGRSEEVVGRAVRDRRHQTLLATKFGWLLDKSGRPQRLDSSPAHVRQACEASLLRLGTDYIDLYLQHRVDPATPIDETAGAVGRLVEEGKVRYFGLSEAAPDTIRRAHQVQPVAALETEYSLWWREPEAELLPLCAELGVAFIAYSPLGRGLLTGAVSPTSAMSVDDLRRTHPRFADENLAGNLALVARVAEVAAGRGCGPGRLALAWLLARPGQIVPIPGTRTIAHLEDNLLAREIELTAHELAAIDAAMPRGSGLGLRHPAAHLPTIDR